MQNIGCRLAIGTILLLWYGQLYAQPWDLAMRPGAHLKQPAPIGMAIQESVALDSTDFAAMKATDYQRLGWQCDLWLMNVPLAWSITKGNSDIVIAIGNRDFISSPDLFADNLRDPEHSDIVWRKFGKHTGNFFLIAKDYYEQEKHPLATYSNGDGIVEKTSLLGVNSHGFSAMTLAVALENGTGMVGVAPRASAFATNVGQDAGMHVTDVDGTANGVIKVPDVETISVLVEESTMKDDIIHGTVLVGGAGNEMTLHGVVSGVQPSACQGISTPIWRMVGPASKPPANVVYEDISTKVIAVGNVGNGNLYRSPCGLYMDGQRIVFEEHKNYAPGREKFPAPDASNALERKKQAFMDIVVPRNELSGMLALTPQGQYDTNPAKRYRHGDAGTSQAVGQVAGVVALLRSVDKYVGVLLDTNGHPVHGADVQKRVYDILTFTARKVEDKVQPYKAVAYGTTATLVYPQSACWSKDGFHGYYSSVLSENDLKNPQLHYVVQTYDKLKRTWAQRMGFGMVDAYRAVAHSIPVKAKYKYQNSTTLSGGHVLNNRYYVHFGSKINEQLDLASGEDRNGGGQQDVELDVLEWGGADLPGEIHNNQGVTRIEGSELSITVTVPQNYIAAIDGIVRTANSTGTHCIATAAGSGVEDDHGLVLLAGMLDGVEVRGRIRVGDVVVNPLSDKTTGLVFQNHGSPSDPLAKVGSEIYGIATLQNNAHLVVDSNATLTLQPGGAIDMQGNQDIVVKSGATLVMEYPSTIKGSGSVVVENGGKLIVKAKPSPDRLWKTEILTRVSIHDGAQLLVEDKALFRVKTFRVERGGEFRCGAESHTVIVDSGVVWGKWYAQGTTDREAVVTGDIDGCGRSVGFATLSVLGAWIVSPSYDVSKNVFHSQYTLFNNIRLSLRNANTEPIEHCTFRAHRDVLGTRELLNITYVGLFSAAGMYTTVENAVVRFCVFQDAKGDKELEQRDGERWNDTYSVTGLVLHGLNKVTVEKSTFQSLMQGVTTAYCHDVLIAQDTFLLSNYAIYDDASALTFCNNVCDKVEFGNGYTYSRASAMVDNTYTNIATSLYATSTAQQFIRNNTITDFREGVYSCNSPLIMNTYTPRDEPCASGVGRTIYKNGYNNFRSDDANNISAEFLPVQNREPLTNKVIRRKKEKQRDIVLFNNSLVSLQDGYNLFALESGYHLSNADPQPIVRTIAVQGNAWSNPIVSYTVRHNAFINPVGNPRNQQANLSVKLCGVLTDCLSSAELFCGDDPYGNDGTWPRRDKTDPYLAAAYASSRQRMMNPKLDALCRRIKAHDALQAATLGVAVEEKLRALVQDYAALEADAASPDVLKTTALMLQGEVYERLSEEALATAAYSTITSRYATTSDSVAAAWRLQSLALRAQLPAGNALYDTAAAAWRNRVLSDMRREYASTSTSVEEVGSGGIGTALFTPIPNPSSGEVEISYTLSHAGVACITIVDALGRTIAHGTDKVCRVSSARGSEQSAGIHRIQFDGTALPAGVYWVRLESATGVCTQPLVIVK